jgi:hypothetical protein
VTEVNIEPINRVMAILLSCVFFIVIYLLFDF